MRPNKPQLLGLTNCFIPPMQCSKIWIPPTSIDWPSATVEGCSKVPEELSRLRQLVFLILTNQTKPNQTQLQTAVILIKNCIPSTPSPVL